MTDEARAALAAADERVRAPAHAAPVVRALALLGWELQFVEMDPEHGRALMSLRRSDGRLVTFDARNGRASTTREMLDHETVTIGRRGDRARVERVRYRLLGRERHEGVRSGLRWLAGYIAENSEGRMLPADARRMLAPLLSAPVAREVG